MILSFIMRLGRILAVHVCSCVWACIHELFYPDLANQYTQSTTQSQSLHVLCVAHSSINSLLSLWTDQLTCHGHQFHQMDTLSNASQFFVRPPATLLPISTTAREQASKRRHTRQPKDCSPSHNLSFCRVVVRKVGRKIPSHWRAFSQLRSPRQHVHQTHR